MNIYHERKNKAILKQLKISKLFQKRSLKQKLGKFKIVVNNLM